MSNRLWMAGALALGIAAAVPGRVMAQHQPAGDLPGPIDSIQDLQDTAKILFKMADTNNDGLISQKEAVDAGNLLVGGFFFRADANGDGVLSPEEARAARDTLFRQQPLLAYVMQKAKPHNAGGAAPGDVRNQPPGQAAQTIAANPGQAIGNLLDTNHDRKIEASELRQAVQQSVQMLFQVADGNQDGQLSPAELNRAVGEAARTAVQIAFQTADTDRNGAISIEEFDKALDRAAHAAFRVLDGNNDNQLSLEELQRRSRSSATRSAASRSTSRPTRWATSSGAGRPPRRSPSRRPRSGRDLVFADAGLIPVRQNPSILRSAPAVSRTSSRSEGGRGRSYWIGDPCIVALIPGRRHTPSSRKDRIEDSEFKIQGPQRRKPYGLVIVWNFEFVILNQFFAVTPCAVVDAARSCPRRIPAAHHMRDARNKKDPVWPSQTGSPVHRCRLIRRQLTSASRSWARTTPAIPRRA